MTPTDGVARGERTRAAVLDAAVALATEDGLDGLSLGQLADRLGVSKSGLFAHWRSKEELQLATDRARPRAVGRRRSSRPALRAPARRAPAVGAARAAARFYAAEDLPGGCFFANAQFEYNARPGAVRDRLAEILARVAGAPRTARRRGDRRWASCQPDVDPRQLAFEIDALGVATVYAVPPARTEAASAARPPRPSCDRLRALCTDPTLLPEELTTDHRPAPVDRRLRTRRAGRRSTSTTSTRWGIVHNARYAVLRRAGAHRVLGQRAATRSTGGGRPPPDVFHAVREFAITYRTPIRGTGEVAVHFWLDQFGETSAVYGFRVLSPDGATVHAEGRRAIVRLDPTTLRPTPWTAAAREVGRAAAQAGGRKKSRISGGALRLQHPAYTSGRWLSRRSRTTSHSDPTAPVFGSQAPNTTVETRASTSAPAHIVHGSRVTTSVQPSSRHVPEHGGGPAQRDDLGVRGRVAGQLPLVAPGGQLGAVRVVDHRADRHVLARRPAPTATPAATAQRAPHPRLVALAGELGRPRSAVTPRAAPRPRRRSRSPGRPRR